MSVKEDKKKEVIKVHYSSSPNGATFTAVEVKSRKQFDEIIRYMTRNIGV